MRKERPDAACEVCTVETPDGYAWDRYARSHPRSSHAHLYGWRRVIAETYGHRSVYLAARQRGGARSLVGILPLVQLRHPFRGNRLISMPFADTGGILADSPRVEKRLLTEALRKGRQLKAESLELRQTTPLTWLDKGPCPGHPPCRVSSHKAGLALTLPGSAERLRRAFPSKLRSQIRKAEKNGLHTEIGGETLLDDFYAVFARNMRDLGSPVHSRKLFARVLEEFTGGVTLFVVRRGRVPLAGGLTLAYRDTVCNPWASSLKEFRHLASNMLLYWAMLEYACRGRFRRFDFGRSSPGAGTFRFKQQWGAQASPLFWHALSLSGKPVRGETLVFDLWKKIPLPVATLLGPALRKHIGL